MKARGTSSGTRLLADAPSGPGFRDPRRGAGQETTRRLQLPATKLHVMAPRMAPYRVTDARKADTSARPTLRAAAALSPSRIPQPLRTPDEKIARSNWHPSDGRLERAGQLASSSADPRRQPNKKNRWNAPLLLSKAINNPHGNKTSSSGPGASSRDASVRARDGRRLATGPAHGLVVMPPTVVNH